MYLVLEVGAPQRQVARLLLLGLLIVDGDLAFYNSVVNNLDSGVGAVSPSHSRSCAMNSAGGQTPPLGGAEVLRMRVLEV